MIVGGESGPGARPFDIAWARSTVEQCKAAGVAPFVKQLGAWILSPSDEGFRVNNYLLSDGSYWKPPVIGANAGKRPPEAVGFSLLDKKGGDWLEWPEDLRVREFPLVRRVTNPENARSLTEAEGAATPVQRKTIESPH